MTISLPTGLVLVQPTFRLVRSVQTSALRGGGGLSVDYAPARWTTKIETPTALEREDVDPIRAFIDRLKGGVERVYMGDWLRRLPIAYRAGFTGLTRAGGGSFDGTADVTALTASTLSLATLPAGFAFGAGDMVGLVDGAYRSLHRVVTAATANGSGVVTVTVEPAIATTVFTTAATANFDSPVCIMALTEEDEPKREARRETAGFTLMQVPF